MLHTRPHRSALERLEHADRIDVDRDAAADLGAFGEGGESYVTLPPAEFSQAQISPTRDSRLGWMQSVLHCTHYIAGAGEQAYLRKEDAPEITFVNRDPIDRSDEAYT